MPEYFDEVDAQDQPTGRRITKRQAHDNNLLHRCVAVFVTNKQGDLYVQLHKKSGLLDHTVGGHVTAGESYHTAALREMFEEIGLRSVQLQELAVHMPSPEYNVQHIFGVYTCQAPADWQFQPNDEVDELRLMSVAAIVADMNRQPRRYTPGFINTMHCYLAAQTLPHKLLADGHAWGLPKAAA